MTDQLHDSDYELIFTRDPDAFIEALWVNLDGDNTIARSKIIFRKWLVYYMDSKKVPVVPIPPVQQVDLDALTRQAVLSTLTSLPLKKTIAGERVDLKKVTVLIQELRR